MVHLPQNGIPVGLEPQPRGLKPAACWFLVPRTRQLPPSLGLARPRQRPKHRRPSGHAARVGGVGGGAGEELRGGAALQELQALRALDHCQVVFCGGAHVSQVQ